MNTGGKKTDGRLVKIVGSILQNAHDLAEWGLETKNLTEDDLRMIVLKRDPHLRREAAVKLVEGGMSQRQAAKVLGVSQWTVSNDVKGNLSKSERKPVTGSDATKAHRAKTAAAAKAGGVTDVPKKKYRIVYADPPWDYAGHAQPDYQTARGDYYPVMALDAICDVPVKDWVEDDAVLFVWVPSPLLEKCSGSCTQWGFEYKQCFVWDKIKHNMGHYNSVRHEFLLICTRGACRPDTKQLIDSVQSIERRGRTARSRWSSTTYRNTLHAWPQAGVVRSIPARRLGRLWACRRVGGSGMIEDPRRKKHGGLRPERRRVNNKRRNQTMSKKRIHIGEGGACPKCRQPMRRYRHPDGWMAKPGKYYFTHRDICATCPHFSTTKPQKGYGRIIREPAPPRPLSFHGNKPSPFTAIFRVRSSSDSKASVAAKIPSCAFPLSKLCRS